LIDFISSADDLECQALTLADTSAAVAVRELSRDESGDERSLLVDLPPGWRAQRRVLMHDVEVFVLEGAITVGNERLGRYSYSLYPAAKPLPSACADGQTGCRLLAFTTTPSSSDAPRSIGPLPVSQMDWERPRTPNFPAGGGRKTLRWDEVEGRGFWVLGVLPHWKSSFTEAHSEEEENYVLEGEIETAVGVMRPGAYLAHPRDAWHGPMRSRPGALVITRARLPFTTMYEPVADYEFPPDA
jgi:hypothetical protein